MKNYRGQTPQNLTLNKILQKIRKNSTPLGLPLLPKGTDFMFSKIESTPSNGLHLCQVWFPQIRSPPRGNLHSYLGTDEDF